MCSVAGVHEAGRVPALESVRPPRVGGLVVHALALSRRVLAVARSILPLRTPVVGAVRGRLAGPAEATAATTSATVGPGLPKTESSKHSQFSYCPYVLFYA